MLNHKQIKSIFTFKYMAVLFSVLKVKLNMFGTKSIKKD